MLRVLRVQPHEHAHDAERDPAEVFRAREQEERDGRCCDEQGGNGLHPVYDAAEQVADNARDEELLHRPHRDIVICFKQKRVAEDIDKVIPEAVADDAVSVLIRRVEQPRHAVCPKDVDHARDEQK